MVTSRGNHGRVRPHERDTNNDIPIIGTNLTVAAAHSQCIKETE